MRLYIQIYALCAALCQIALILNDAMEVHIRNAPTWEYMQKRKYR